MTILSEDKIIRFRNKLYQKTVPRILKSGGKDLNPMTISKVDAQGKFIVLTKEITGFFLSVMEGVASHNSDQYVADLYLLFDVLTKEAENYSFLSDMRISEKEISEASNKMTIEYLTKNIIITYFNLVKLPNGQINRELLDHDLKNIIKLSNEGRDYKTLIGRVLENLVETLKLAKPWRQSLEDIEDAALVCRLVGARLPQIDKTVLSRIVSESRAEIKNNVLIFSKLLNTRAQSLNAEQDHKPDIKTLDKLDQAIIALLKKIDSYLNYAHRFIKLIGASTQGFLGQVDANLRADIAAFFFDYEVTESHGPEVNPPRNFASSRYRMATLFDYPQLTVFSRSLLKDNAYRECVLDSFRMYYTELIKQMVRLSMPDSAKDFKKIEAYIAEIIRMIRNFELEPEVLRPLKKEVQSKYISLIRVIPLEPLSTLTGMKENISMAIQDESKSLLEDIRKALEEACYLRLMTFDIESMTYDELHLEILKLLTGYALNYKPQRFFYQKFLARYVMEADGALSGYMTDLLKTKRSMALNLLGIFSDPKYVGDFISKEQMALSEQLHKRFLGA